MLAVLARSGLPLTGLQTARLADASPERVRQVLIRLREDGLVTARRAGSAVLHEANRDHLLWNAVARLVHDADQVVHSLKGRISVAIGDVLGNRAPHVTAALFGSVARGESRQDSDVDVLLITPDEIGESDVEALVERVIDTVQISTGNVCNVYAASRARFDELVATADPMIPSWVADATVFSGPDFRPRLGGAPWDEPRR